MKVFIYLLVCPLQAIIGICEYGMMGDLAHQCMCIYVCLWNLKGTWNCSCFETIKCGMPRVSEFSVEKGFHLTAVLMRIIFYTSNAWCSRVIEWFLLLLCTAVPTRLLEWMLGGLTQTQVIVVNHGQASLKEVIQLDQHLVNWQCFIFDAAYPREETEEWEVIQCYTRILKSLSR